MPENWAPCRNCPHLPDEHEAVVIKPICVDLPARVLFEGTLGACRVSGCACQMWMHARPSRRELAREGRDVPEGFELVAVQDKDWRVQPGHPCRRQVEGRHACGKPSVAAMNRKRRTSRGTADSWWPYCADHMYGRWVEGGSVMVWILQEAGGSVA